MSRIDDLIAIATANTNAATGAWNTGFDFERLNRRLMYFIDQAESQLDLPAVDPPLLPGAYPWVFQLHADNLRTAIVNWRSPDDTSFSVTLLAPNEAASAAATNLAANTFAAVGDPAYRWMGDLRGKTALRIMGRIGGALTPNTAIRIQGHPGGDPAVATGDAGWATLATSPGGHTLNALFYTAELPVPAGAQRNHILIRAGLFGGNGVADPTLTCCILNFYAG